MIQTGAPDASTLPASPTPDANRVPLGGCAERLGSLRVVEVPDVCRDKLAGSILGQSVDVPDGPPGMDADPLQAEAHRLLDRSRLVSRRRDCLQQLEEGRLLAQRKLGLLALGDVAPQLDDLERFAAPVADQTLLVPDPAIVAILVAEPVLDDVAARSSSRGNSARTRGRSSG